MVRVPYLPIGFSFINKKRIIKMYFLKDFHLDIIIPNPSIMVDESLTRCGDGSIDYIFGLISLFT